ncbi:hypothetical protein MASR2M117_06430 [Paludibacter sp.]
MNIDASNIRYFLNNIRNKGFFHLLSANVLIQVFAFASQLFVAGIISPDDLGRIKIIQTYLAIFSIIAGMGFNSSVLKICSENHTAKENSKYFSSAFIFTLITSSLTYTIILIINHLGYLSKDLLVKFLIPLGMLPLITNSIFALFMALFQAKKEIKLFSNLTIFNKLISIVGIIVLTYFFGINGYYVAYNLSFIILILVAFIFFKRIFPFTLSIKNFGLFKEHWKYAKYSTLSNIIEDTSTYIDILLISFMINDMENIGYYSFALTLTVLYKLFPSSVQQITIPYVSSFKSNKDEFLKIFRRYNRLLYIVVVATLVISVMLAPIFIEIVFGGKYNQSISFFIFLSIGWSIRHLIQLQSAAIFGLGQIKYNALTSLCGLLANIIIYPIAIYSLGLMGAAYASISSGLIVWIASKFYFRKAVQHTEWKE